MPRHSDDATIQVGTHVGGPDELARMFAGTRRLAVEAPVAAGWTTSFRFALDGTTPSQGLALLEFVPGSRQIARARFFTADKG
jgi:hypothetical protein